MTDAASTTSHRVSESRRREILDRAIATYVSHGYSVALDTGRTAVVTKRRQINIPLNVVLIALTGGVWLIVLGFRMLSWPKERVLLTVDRWGTVTGEFS